MWKESKIHSFPPWTNEHTHFVFETSSPHREAPPWPGSGAASVRLFGPLVPFVCFCISIMGACVLSRSVGSTSSQPCGLQPARLLCPWDSPGKNTGGGCHALLQGTFPSQGLNPHLLWLLHGRLILCHWATRKAHSGITPSQSLSLRRKSSSFVRTRALALLGPLHFCIVLVLYCWAKNSAV